MLQKCALRQYPNPLDVVITIVAISRKTKVPKAGPNIVYKRSYNKISNNSNVDAVKNICWSVVCNEEQPDAALDTFRKCLIPVAKKQHPLRK
jgi:hypothetical protein